MQLSAACLVADDDGGVVGAVSACHKADLVLVTINSRGIFLYSVRACIHHDMQLQLFSASRLCWCFRVFFSFLTIMDVHEMKLRHFAVHL